MVFPLSSHANKAGVKWAYFTCPARMLPLYSCAGKSGRRQETVAAACVIGEETGVPSDTSPVQHYRHYASSVIRSLRSVMTLRRALPAQEEGHDGECKRAEELPIFHRLRPPDETHRNQVISGAQIRSGET